MSWITPKTNWQPTEYVNVGDMNRIEGNIRFLRDTLNAMSYRIPDQVHRSWVHSGLPNIGDIRRICENIRMIAEHYFRPPHHERLLVIPTKAAIDNQDANDIEEFLRWLNAQRLAGRLHNRHQDLAPFTHAQLAGRRHIQLREEGL